LASNSQLGKYNCTYIITYNEEDEGFFSYKFRAERTAKTLEFKIKEMYPHISVKYVIHNWQALKQAMTEIKCICGLIYVGHGTWNNDISTLVFRDTNGIAVERTKHSIPVTDLPTENLIPESVSVLIACRSGSMRYSRDSIAKKMSEHFKGNVMGSENKLNLNKEGPNTPKERGGTKWNIFSSL